MNTVETKVTSACRTALQNPDFQEWLRGVGLVVRDSEASLEQFERLLNKLHLTEIEEQILEAFKPYGYPKYNADLAKSVYGHSDKSDIHAFRTHFSRAWAKVKNAYKSGELAQIPSVMRSGTPIRGIGFQLHLAQVEVAIASLIPWQTGESPRSSADLAETLFPPQDFDPDNFYGRNNFRSCLHRMENALPQSLTLIRTGARNAVSYRWSSLYDQATKTVVKA